MGDCFKILILLGLCMLPNGFALPTNYGEDEQIREENCIRMTPENENKISAIVVKLSEFLYNLSLEYEEFDISLAKIIIDGHSESEEDEKELQIQLIVNDCDSNDFRQATANASELIGRNNDGVTDEELVEILELEFSQSDDQEDNEEDSPKIESSSGNDHESDETRQPSKAKNGHDDRQIAAPVYENVEKSDKAVVDNSEKVNQEEDQAIYPENGKAPELIRIEFDENGKQLIEEYQKKLGKKPLVVYVQKLEDNNMSYLFLN